MKKLLLSAFVLFALASCGGDRGEKDAAENSDAGLSTEKKEKAIQIALIPKGTTHSFWKAVHAGGEKAAREEGIKLIWQGPQKEDDRMMQIQVVQNFISRGVDAIVLAPLDDRALVKPVMAATRRNIPVVIIDSDLRSEEHSSFVATDNTEGGKMCAKRLAELMGEAGTNKIIMMRYLEGSASTAQREEGFLTGLEVFAPEAEILSADQYAGSTIEKAYQTAQNLLNRYPDVQGIFCSNEAATQGMLRALQNSGKAGKITFVGFDSNPTLIKALKDGQINGLAVQNPFKMGYEGVRVAAAVVRGDNYEKQYDTGVVMATPDNIEKPEIKEVLYPDVETYLKD